MTSFSTRFSWFFAVFAILVLLFSMSGAARAAEWPGLVPACGATPDPVKGARGETTRTYTPCSTCDLAVLVKNALDFVWKYVALAGVALMLMIGGFQMVTGAIGGSATAHQKGLATIKNAFIGLAIVLFAWLAVDTIIKFIAQQSLTSGSPAKLFEDEPGAGEPVQDLDFSISSHEIGYGFWNKIKCATLDSVKVTTRPSSPPSAAARLPSGTAMGVHCAPNDPNCGPDALRAIGYTPAQANTMSCIAIYESRGDPLATNPTTGACGTFQVLPSNWRKGELHNGSCTPSTDCHNAGCNMQTAFLLSVGRVRDGKSPYSDWTCPGCDPKGTKQACVNENDPRWATRL